MKLTKAFIVLLFLLVFSLKGGAQDCSNLKVLGLTKMHPVKELPIIDERDVMWHRRLWREIDLTEKRNQYLYLGKVNESRACSLYDLIFNKLISGYIKAYDPKDDKFSKELTVNELIRSVGDSIYDESGGLIYKQLKGADVIKFWLKEDWFFNSKHAKIEVRIVGVCPVKIKIDKNGNVIGYQQLFWLYFPNLRSELSNMEAFKKEVDKSRVSFDDVFIERMFDSYIIQKEEGEKQYTKHHKTGLDIKLEGEKTKFYHYKKEIGLWGN